MTRNVYGRCNRVFYTEDQPSFVGALESYMGNVIMERLYRIYIDEDGGCQPRYARQFYSNFIYSDFIDFKEKPMLKDMELEMRTPYIARTVKGDYFYISPCGYYYFDTDIPEEKIDCLWKINGVRLGYKDGQILR